ncbi:hypothetical protein [Runella sp.]|uniref:hypothetical protein n=1 Tax=Runella sp. TaxID=1960881 RepID=UPI003D12F83C
MKKLLLSAFLTIVSFVAFADVVIDPPKKSPDFTSQPAFKLLLPAGIVALGILVYVRQRRVKNNS